MIGTIQKQTGAFKKLVKLEWRMEQCSAVQVSDDLDAPDVGSTFERVSTSLKGLNNKVVEVKGQSEVL